MYAPLCCRVVFRELNTFGNIQGGYLRTITYGNAQKYLRIHFFFGFFFGVLSHGKGAWFSSAWLIRSISMSAEVGSEKNL